LGDKYTYYGDYAQAIHWYIKAAEQGDNRVLYQLGILYASFKEYTKALQWCRKAAKHGYKHAVKVLRTICSAKSIKQMNAQEKLEVELSILEDRAELVRKLSNCFNTSENEEKTVNLDDAMSMLR
jgi:TPR repeat protein